MIKNYDIVIVSHEKDFGVIKHIVNYADKNLKFDSIHLILSEREPFTELDILKSHTNKPIFIHNETDVLSVDKSRIKFRPNWIYQMLLKLFQNVTQHDNFLVIESDCVILKPLDFFNGEKTIFYMGRDHFNQPYFNFNSELLGIGREFDHSFICEFMMYDKKLIKDLLTKSSCNDVNDFLELIYKHTNEDCYMADYELYGNFVYKYHRDKFETKKLNLKFLGRHYNDSMFWSNSEIDTIISENEDKDIVTFHTWGLN
jgi:hypothetical protein